MSQFSKIFSWTGVFLSLSMAYGQGGLKLPQIFSDQMVLQRDIPVPIWGWAKPGKKVILEMGTTIVETTADKNGKWELTLPPQKAGGPYLIDISSGNSQKQFKEVLFGEVWLCGGQSNMQYSLGTLKKDSAIANSSNNQIRLFQVPRRVGFLPQEDFVRGSWQPCNPNTVAEFSAVAYFYGKILEAELGVPIGLISSNYGGSVLETWLSPEAALTVPYYAEAVKSLGRTKQNEVKRKSKRAYKLLRKGMGKLNEKAFQGGKATWVNVNYDDSRWGEMKLPGFWDDQGLQEFDGSVWFRKEIIIDEVGSDEQFILSFGKFDDAARIWVNGSKWPGLNYSSNNFINLSLPKEQIKKGKNVIAIRLTDTGGPGGAWGPDSSMVLRSQKQQFNLAGTWKFRLSNEDIRLDIPGDRPNDMPTLLYNSMIHPLGPLAMRGVIWYQGESNADRGWEYQSLFKLLINDWRRQFRRDISFYFVQLANFVPNWYSINNSSWAELREAQRKSLDIPNTGMAVAIDIGDGQNIHPTNKEDVGLRLALNALARDYGSQIPYSGPIYKEIEAEGDTLRLSFGHTEGELRAKGEGELKGFEIAGEDRAFAPAQAWIKGDEVILYCSYVSHPIAARYAWKDNPEEANLINGADLPASPFRTYDWPLDSKGKIKKYYPFKE